MREAGFRTLGIRGAGCPPVRTGPHGPTDAAEGGPGWGGHLDQAIGKDMPTGLGAAAGDGICMTGSSIGDSAIRPRAA